MNYDILMALINIVARIYCWAMFMLSYWNKTVSAKARAVHVPTRSFACQKSLHDNSVNFKSFSIIQWALEGTPTFEEEKKIAPISFTLIMEKENLIKWDAVFLSCKWCWQNFGPQSWRKWTSPFWLINHKWFIWHFPRISYFEDFQWTS